MNTTLITNPIEKDKSWYIVDAKDFILGRLAVKIANVLRGRHKPSYTPHTDTGDYVIVINADKIKLSGKKEEQKQYMFFSGWRGNEKYVSLTDFRKKNPAFIIENAVKGMLPRNKLSRKMIKKLKVYGGDSHPHNAQEPKKFEF